MNRRGFLGKLAGVLAAPLAAVGLAKAVETPEDVWSMPAQWVPKETFLETYPPTATATMMNDKTWYFLNTDYMTFNGKQIQWDPYSPAPVFEQPRRKRRKR